MELFESYLVAKSQKRHFPMAGLMLKQAPHVQKRDRSRTLLKMRKKMQEMEL